MMRKDIIGSVLLEERKKQGKTLRDIANKLGWSLSTLSSIERGFISVADEKYREYAKELEMAESLFGIEDEMTKREKEIMSDLRHIEDILNGNPQVALERIESYTDIHHFLDAITFAHFLKGRIYFEQKDFVKSKKYLEQTLKKLDESPKLATSNLHCICLNDLARIAFYTQDYQTSYRLAKQAIELFVADGQRNYYKPYLLLNQIIYLEKLNRIEEACRCCEQLLGEKDSYKTNLYIVIQIYERYAIMLSKLGMPIKALDYAQQGLQIAWENESYRRLFSLWITIGDINVTLERFEEAEVRYQKSLDLIHHVSDTPNLICEIYVKFAQLLIKLGKEKKAEQTLVQAKKYKIESNDFKTKIYYLLAKLQQKQNRLEEATETYNHLERMLITNKIPVDICLALCEFYKETGNEQKMVYYQQLIFQTIKEGIV
jgi:tetratricopeptide (TPR) repeat protein